MGQVKQLTNFEKLVFFQTQNQLMWKLRDSLSKEVSNEDKKTLLSDNNQVIPSGESRVSGQLFGVVRVLSVW